MLKGVSIGNISLIKITRLKVQIYAMSNKISSVTVMVTHSQY